MQFPKLTPLQSRFAATLIATVFLIALYYILLTNPGSFAYALDVEHRVPVDLASPLLIEESPPLNDGAKAAVIRRAPSGTASLGNNQFQLMNINLGETQYWVFPKEAVLGPTSPPTPGLPAYIPANTSSGDVVVSHGSELKKRDDTETFDEDIDDHGGNSPSKRAVTVYISMNTCLKPSLNTTASTASQNTTLPALQVYISKSTTLQKPGPGVSDSLQSVYSADGGYMAAEISADDDVYIAVSAPNSTAYSGIYNYQLAASIDAYFHAVEDTVPNLFFVDSDVNSALLVTDNTTQSAPNSTNYQQWMNLTPPYTIFANNINNTATAGLERSFCALNQLAQLRAGNTAINVGMTNRGLGNQPKEQFYVTNLNGSSTYYGILGMKGNSTAADNGVVGGGGKVWRPMNFTTKAGLCQCFIFIDV
jgi:calcium channel MID1